jgi:hypothetical protein
MIELLNGRGQQIVEPTGDVVLLFDYDTMTNLVDYPITASLVDASIDRVNLIDGVPVLSKDNMSTSRLVINFGIPLDFSVGNWTFEWSTFTTQLYGGYSGEMWFDGGNVSNAGFASFFGDYGFGNRIMLADGQAPDTADLWRPLHYKADMLNKLVRYACVYRNGFFSFFIDGKKQAMENGVTNGTVKTDVPLRGLGKGMTRLEVGRVTGYSHILPNIGRVGRIRVSKFARYSSDYTPTPF